jgi:hypothetical protein
MLRIFDAIRVGRDNAIFNRCEVVRTSVIVGNTAQEGAGEDELDPPFNMIYLNSVCLDRTDF